jgi:ABC-2 type transport system permease protein
LLIDLEYRANFIMQATLSIWWSLMNIFTATVFYLRTDDIGGWRYDQALIIIGLFNFMVGVVSTFLEPNVRRIVTMIREGTMDFVLTKPVNSQFIASLRHSRAGQLVYMLSGVVIVGIGLARVNYVPSLSTVIQFIIMLCMAVLIVYSIWIMMATIAFWLIKIDELGELFNSLFDTARFPITVYSGAIRIALTFVLPIAFMTTFPAQAVLNTLDWRWLVTALVMGVGLLLLSMRLWRVAVRNYSSASS